MRLTTLLVLAIASTGCDQVVSSSGQEARLSYSLVTDNEVPELELTEALIVAGHEQRLKVSLTAAGYDEVSMPERIQHRVLPSDGITVLHEPPAGREPPDVLILASQPGIYTLESRVGEELVDRINLTFDSPADFDLASFVRAPRAADFVPVAGNDVSVEEGTQVTLKASPVNAEGRRLAGDLQSELTIDPPWAVVPGVGVVDTGEDGVWSMRGDIDFYFIEPATVSFTLVDPVSGAMSTQSFLVSPVVVPSPGGQ